MPPPRIPKRKARSWPARMALRTVLWLTRKRAAASRIVRRERSWTEESGRTADCDGPRLESSPRRTVLGSVARCGCSLSWARRAVLKRMGGNKEKRPQRRDRLWFSSPHSPIFPTLAANQAPCRQNSGRSHFLGCGYCNGNDGTLFSMVARDRRLATGTRRNAGRLWSTLPFRLRSRSIAQNKG